MKRTRFDEELLKLSLAFGQKINTARVELYYDSLKNYDEIELLIAFKNCMLKSDFFPSIAEIVSEISPLDASRSWAKVLRMAQNGCRDWQNLTDLEVATISVIGGMREIQNADDKSIHFLSQKYLIAFPLMKTRNVTYDNQSVKLVDLNVDSDTYRYLKPKDNFIPQKKITGHSIGSILPSVLKEIKGI